MSHFITFSRCDRWNDSDYTVRRFAFSPGDRIKQLIMALICISILRSLPHAIQKNTKVHRPAISCQPKPARKGLEEARTGVDSEREMAEYSQEKTATSAPGRRPLFVRNISLARRSLVGRRLSFHFKFNRMVWELDGSMSTAAHWKWRHHSFSPDQKARALFEISTLHEWASICYLAIY